MYLSEHVFFRIYVLLTYVELRQNWYYTFFHKEKKNLCNTYHIYDLRLVWYLSWGTMFSHFIMVCHILLFLLFQITVLDATEQATPESKSEM